MGSIWHNGVAVPDLQKGRKELVVCSLGSPAAMPFEVALALEGVVNRFDPLADPADRAVAGCLVAAATTLPCSREVLGSWEAKTPYDRRPKEFSWR